MTGKQGVAGYYLIHHKREAYNYVTVGGDSHWVEEQCQTLREAGYERIMKSQPNQCDIMHAILIRVKPVEE